MVGLKGGEGRREGIVIFVFCFSFFVRVYLFTPLVRGSENEERV